MTALKALGRTTATRLYGQDRERRSASPLHVYVVIGSVKLTSKCSCSARQVAILSEGNLLRALGKVSMHEVHRHGAFTDCRSNALNTTCSRIANSEDSGHAGFEHEWRPL